MVCKCSIMRPQNESARLPGACPAAPLPLLASLCAGGGGAAGEEAGPLPGGAGGVPCQSSQLPPPQLGLMADLEETAHPQRLGRWG